LRETSTRQAWSVSLSVRRLLDDRERVKVSDAPAVNNLGTERDLVVALQVAVAVRVTVTDQLKADLLLHTPADSGEVARDAEDAGRVSGYAGSAHGLRDRSAVPLKLRGVGAVRQAGVNLATVRVALLRERDSESRVQRQIRRNIARTENQRISRVHREIPGRTTSSLDRIRVGELLRHSGSRRARARGDAVSAARAPGTRQGGPNLRQHLLDNAELVILIRPLDLIGHANSLLELERLDPLHRTGELGRGLVLPLTDVLGLIGAKDESLTRTELHRNAVRQRRNNRPVRNPLEPRIKNLNRDVEPASRSSKNSHLRLLNQSRDANRLRVNSRSSPPLSMFEVRPSLGA